MNRGSFSGGGCGCGCCGGGNDLLTLAGLAALVMFLMMQGGGGRRRKRSTQIEYISSNVTQPGKNDSSNNKQHFTKDFINISIITFCVNPQTSAISIFSCTATKYFRRFNDI